MLDKASRHIVFPLFSNYSKKITSTTSSLYTLDLHSIQITRRGMITFATLG